MSRQPTQTRTALVANPWSIYGREPVEVRVGRSKARAAGDHGVQFTAPGWRPMAFRSMDAAVRKLEAHPGFVRWTAPINQAAA